MYTHEADKKIEQSINTNQDNSFWQQKCNSLEKKIETLTDKIRDLEKQELKYEFEIQKLKTDVDDLEYQLNNPEEVEDTETIAGLPKEMVQNAVMGILGLTQKQNSSQPINGIEVEGPENKTEKLKSILQRIKAVDHNYVENLEVLAKFMEQQPKQYFAFLPTMKGLTV
jgi:chromosome segregation ATPase